jgi:hypothetical protein
VGGRGGQTIGVLAKALLAARSVCTVAALAAAVEVAGCARAALRQLSRRRQLASSPCRRCRS